MRYLEKKKKIVWNQIYCSLILYSSEEWWFKRTSFVYRFEHKIVDNFVFGKRIHFQTENEMILLYHHEMLAENSPINWSRC